MGVIHLLWGGVKRTVTGYEVEKTPATPRIDMKAVVAELIGTFLLTYVGCGAATVHGAGATVTRLIIACSFGMSVVAIAYSIGHHSGGHLNCAVTFSLVMGGVVSWNQGLANLASQCLGSIFACVMLSVIHSCDVDLTASLATNMPAPGFEDYQVVIAETVGTFLLCFTVWETAVTPVKSCGNNSCLAIGCSVFLAINVLIHVDGCSINPNRSLGPALVSRLRGCANGVTDNSGLEALWMMWVGPLLGGLLAAMCRVFLAPQATMLSSEVPVNWGLQRTATGFGDESKKKIDMKAGFAEFIGTMLLVIVGCGAASLNGADTPEKKLIIALTFGVGVMVIASSTGHHSGGQLNCAVTFSLCLGGAVSWAQGAINFVAQSIGAIVGAMILAIIIPCDKDLTTSLASNMAAPGFSEGHVLLGEAMGTFVLCFTVWETAVNPRSSCGKNSYIAIGASVCISVCLLLTVDGCSINPTRSLGPAVVSSIRGCDNYTPGAVDALWMMFVGPLLGAAAAALVRYPLDPTQKLCRCGHVAESEALAAAGEEPAPEEPKKPATKDPSACAAEPDPSKLRQLAITWGIKRTVTGYNKKEAAKRVLDLKAFVAELIGTCMLCVVGCGAAMSYGPVDGPTRLVVAAAFGCSVLVIAYSVGHHSGGQLNPAVTFSLVVGKAVPWYQGLLNFVGQMMGSLIGSGILCAIYPCEADLTTNLASNMGSPGYTDTQCVIAEAMGTFMLCFAVWENAVTPISSCGKNACIAIGLAVFVGVLTLLPVTGCSINPARSFGPAVVASMRGCDNYTPGGMDALWIMFVGPLLGGAVAAVAHQPFIPSQAEIDFKKKPSDPAPPTKAPEKDSSPVVLNVADL
mmetsp:Transcript_1839/g.4493  ORF Transcript_1839/g.4493 Transcript_1839/m.4493 type:complete len:858 (-) Transcript_1839:71-2644(-)